MDKKFKEIEEKVKKFLGIKELPDYEIKVNKSLSQRTAFNKKVGDKYTIYISPDNYNGLKHELIHLALKKFSYKKLKADLPVPGKYKKDNRKTCFMEYLTICLEIKMGSKDKIKENLDNYEKYGFSQIKESYNITDKNFKKKIDQKLINKIIKTNRSKR